eukprot:750177-Hanusia_phi.AAC.1
MEAKLRRQWKGVARIPDAQERTFSRIEEARDEMGGAEEWEGRRDGAGSMWTRRRSGAGATGAGAGSRKGLLPRRSNTSSKDVVEHGGISSRDLNCSDYRSDLLPGVTTGPICQVQQFVPGFLSASTIRPIMDTFYHVSQFQCSAALLADRACHRTVTLPGHFAPGNFPVIGRDYAVPGP